MIQYALILILLASPTIVYGEFLKETSIYLAPHSSLGDSLKYWGDFCETLSKRLQKTDSSYNLPLFDQVKCFRENFEPEDGNYWIIEANQEQRDLLKFQVIFNAGTRVHYLNNIDFKAPKKGNPFTSVKVNELYGKLAKSLPFFGRIAIKKGDNKFNFDLPSLKKRVLILFRLRFDQGRFAPKISGAAFRKKGTKTFYLDDFYSEESGIYFIRSL